MNTAFEEELKKVLKQILDNKNNINHGNLKLLKYLANKKS